jgi:enamine deaminase RidA (YjgF/YER057c/UK114 family)
MSGFSMEYLNPEGLPRSAAFSQAISVRGPARTIYIGGQNAVNARGELVGPGDLKLQTRQALLNIRTILDAAGASFRDLVKLNIHLVQGCNPREGFAAYLEVVGPLDPPPLVTALFVAGLGNPGWLVEIDGVAVTADDGR